MVRTQNIHYNESFQIYTDWATDIKEIHQRWRRSKEQRLSVGCLFYVFVLSGLTSASVFTETQWPGEVPLLRENYANLKGILVFDTSFQDKMKRKDDQKVGSNALSLCNNSRVLMILGFRVNCFYFKKQSLLQGTETLAWLVITKNLLQPTGSFKFHTTHVKVTSYVQ